jgi:hypothetical protein
VDYPLFDSGSHIDGIVHICRVEGCKSVDAIEYLASSTIRQIDVVFRIRIWCFWRFNHFWIQFVFPTNLFSQSHHGIVPLREMWDADIDHLVFHSAIFIGIGD